MQVKFVEWDVLRAFGDPHMPETRLKAQTSLGYAPWPFFGGTDGEERMGVIAHCSHCGMTGSLHFRGSSNTWSWNGDADNPTLSPSVYMPKDDHGFCGFHCWVRDGQIIDAGTPAHGEA